MPVTSVGIFAPAAVIVEDEKPDFFWKPIIITFQAEMFWYVKCVGLKPHQRQWQTTGLLYFNHISKDRDRDSHSNSDAAMLRPGCCEY